MNKWKKVTNKRKRSGKKKINKATNEIDGQDVNGGAKYKKNGEASTEICKFFKFTTTVKWKRHL